MSEYIVVYVTAPDEQKAASIAYIVVEDKLAACVNIIKGIKSIYLWEGKLETEAECLMIIKTRRSLFPALQKRIKELHPYKVPEIIAAPIIEGSMEYLLWVKDSTEGFA